MSGPYTPFRAMGEFQGINGAIGGCHSKGEMSDGPDRGMGEAMVGS